MGLSAQVTYLNDFDSVTNGQKLNDTDNFEVWGDSTSVTDEIIIINNDDNGGANSSKGYIKMPSTGYCAFATTFEATVGTTYTISLKYKKVSGSGSVKVNIKKTGSGVSPYISSSALTASSWTEYSTQFTPTTSETIQVVAGRSWVSESPEYHFDDFSISCDNCSSLSVDSINDFQFNIYPNPAKDVISFQTELPLERVEIFSLTGSKVLSQSNNVEQVEVGNLAKGIYMLKASAVDGKVATQKLIKE
jgi:hypothetical protein